MTRQREQDGERAGGFSPVGLALRVAAFSALWLVLTGGAVAKSWYLGAATIALATWSTYFFAPSGGRRVQLKGLVQFIPYFVRRSLYGGVDVGLRALRPSRPLAPEVVSYELTLPQHAPARAFFAAVISLLPGTLCAQLSASHVEIHTIDRSWPIEAQMAELEARVAAVFGLELIDEAGEGAER